ncbi:hypothetical protein [Actibacterium lipolyticum]|uniref:Uncharacterized protein n=1 Tax=Actibacterium lipolyticum TaxID=1524263 RepID=A0A238KN18_9RHOB|nr:hypothetical protein [Actibacterium lipolyticum]SMX44203.1 hypothetical protein COL8621_02497 [Actibacterium lipolyticum]
MAPLLELQTPLVETPRAPVPFDDEMLQRLNKLRLLAMRCRAAAHLDMFTACALLSQNKDEAASAFAEAMLRTLQQGLGRPAVFYAPGTKEVSFDEAWLLRMMSCVRDGDQASFTFLISSVLDQSMRRSVAFLVRGLAERLTQL